MIVLGGQQIGRRIDGPQIDPRAATLQFPGLQVILQIGVAQVKAVHRPWQVGVPVQQIERRGLLPLKVLVDVVVPPQLVRSQQRKSIAHVFAAEKTCLIAPTANGTLTISHQLFVDEHADWPGIQIVEKGRQQAHAADFPVTACREYRQRGTQ
ncbi:hypothetical protein D3C76_1343750 [compost metagenome]